MVFAQQRDQYHSRSHEFNDGDFREISCRTFQFGAGILPNPHVVHKEISYDQNPKQIKKITKSCSVSIPIRGSVNEIFYSELWAGPAYSNSPPPSSLPIPKFSTKPKRTVSLESPSVSASDVDLFTLIMKSAPTSPASDSHGCFQMEFLNSRDDSATKTLRRILNLDLVKSD